MTSSREETSQGRSLMMCPHAVRVPGSLVAPHHDTAIRRVEEESPILGLEKPLSENLGYEEGLKVIRHRWVYSLDSDSLSTIIMRLPVYTADYGPVFDRRSSQQHINEDCEAENFAAVDDRVIATALLTDSTTPVFGRKTS
ncbi:hypothetical protein AAL_05324 [Moelleriella libera RCEF 2490]|uniref:Uncharacterized protein n=1 Tax=Moelleriella libera RCEF 2490 TaxID=1081109 RepID=A0A168AU41_9HYPO|nr:hypothetical protein AAL_05324 [Moelleriella libera RCEF 2490]